MKTFEQVAEEFIDAISTPAKRLELIKRMTKTATVSGFLVKLEAEDFKSMDEKEKKLANACKRAYNITKEYINVETSNKIVYLALLSLDLEQMYKPIAKKLILDRHKDAAHEDRYSNRKDMTKKEWEQDRSFVKVWGLFDDLYSAKSLVVYAKNDGKNRFAELYEFGIEGWDLETIRINMEMSKRQFDKMFKDAVSYAIDYHDRMVNNAK